MEQINKGSGKFFTPFCLKMKAEYFTKIFTQMQSIVLDTWVMDCIIQVRVDDLVIFSILKIYESTRKLQQLIDFSPFYWL